MRTSAAIWRGKRGGSVRAHWRAEARSRFAETSFTAEDAARSRGSALPITAPGIPANVLPKAYSGVFRRSETKGRGGEWRCGAEDLVQHGGQGKAGIRPKGGAELVY